MYQQLKQRKVRQRRASCSIDKALNILVKNNAQQNLEDGHDKLRHGLESAGETGTDLMIGIRKIVLL